MYTNHHPLKKLCFYPPTITFTMHRHLAFVRCGRGIKAGVNCTVVNSYFSSTTFGLPVTLLSLKMAYKVKETRIKQHH